VSASAARHTRTGLYATKTTRVQQSSFTQVNRQRRSTLRKSRRNKRSSN